MVLWGAYSLRNLWARRVTTMLTVTGLGLVVFVFVAILMLAHGLERTMGKTGDQANAILLRKGALSEIDSYLPPDQTKILASQPEFMQLTLRKSKEGSLARLSLRDWRSCRRSANARHDALRPAPSESLHELSWGRIFCSSREHPSVDRLP